MDFRLAVIDYVVIALYLVLMLGVGSIFSKLMKGGQDFFVGSRKIPWWVAGISLYMSLFSAWTFTGAASFTYNTGWFGVLNFVLWPVSLLIGFLISAHRWRRARITSPVEYVKTRYNKATHVCLTVFLIISSLYWPAHHLASLSKICAPALFPNSMLAIDAMIVGVGIIILFYTFSGGLWAVAITDVIQFLIFISVCGVLLPACFLSGDLGTIPEFIARTPPLEFNHTIRGNATFTHWFLIGNSIVFIFAYSTGGNIQRYLSVKDERAARRTGWLAVGLFALAPILFGIPPLIGKVLWPDLTMLPFLANISKPDENVFLAVIFKYMPAGMVGLFLAAMMAASMSAMDSAWNSVSAIVTIDIYQTFINPNASERETLIVGRFTVIALAITAIIAALVIIHSEYGVFTISAIVLGLIGIPVTIPLFVGILSRNISRWSAISSVLAGTLVAAVGRFLLHYNLGPQYLVTIGVALLFVYLSRPLGKLHVRGKMHSLTANIVLAVSLYGFFAHANNNPALSLMNLQVALADSLVAVLSSPPVLLAYAMLALLALSQFFMRLYASDLAADQSEVDRFFAKLASPVDVAREVGDDTAESLQALHLVGKIAIGLSLVAIAMLIFPEARTHVWINLTVFAILAGIGGALAAVARNRENRIRESFSSEIGS